MGVAVHAVWVRQYLAGARKTPLEYIFVLKQRYNKCKIFAQAQAITLLQELGVDKDVLKRALAQRVLC